MRSATTRSSSPAPTGRAIRSEIPGVGQAISDKIAELAPTGHLAFYDRLAAEVPAGLRRPAAGSRASARRRSGSSPSRSAIADLDGLREAAQGGRMRTVKGLSEKAEASILAGIASLETRAATGCCWARPRRSSSGSSPSWGQCPA